MVCAWVLAQLLSRVWPCDPVDCSPPGSSVHWIFQARTLEWAASSSTRWSSRPRDRTLVSCISCIGRRIFYPDTKTVGHNSFLNFQFHVSQGWPAFSVNGQMANVLSFTGRTVSVGITQLFHCSTRAAIDNMYRVLMKLYSQRRATGWVSPVRHSWLAPEISQNLCIFGHNLKFFDFF